MVVPSSTNGNGFTTAIGTENIQALGRLPAGIRWVFWVARMGFDSAKSQSAMRKMHIDVHKRSLCAKNPRLQVNPLSLFHLGWIAS